MTPAKKGDIVGFSVMTPEKRREIARIGGIYAHRNGKAHEFTSDEARDAGRIGGAVTAKDRDHMAEIGRRGGKARARNRKKRLAERQENEPDQG